MAQTLPSFNGQTKIVNALDTYNHTIVAAGLHTVEVTVNDQIPPMGLIITIAQSGSASASFSSSAPVAGQTHVSLKPTINFAVGDNLAITLSSSTPSDQAPNGFKAMIRVVQAMS